VEQVSFRYISHESEKRQPEQEKGERRKEKGERGLTRLDLVKEAYLDAGLPASSSTY